MAQIVLPPEERFDPITARWVTPGGWLSDPQRDQLDPEHGEPVELVGPLPRELSEPAASPVQSHGSLRRRQIAVLVMVGLFLLAIGVGGLILY